MSDAILLPSGASGRAGADAPFEGDELPDFWASSAHHLVERNEAGRLVATDALLKAYLARPEIVPPPEACAAERALHARLLIAPRDPVSARDVAALADPDARENVAQLLAFRDLLLAQPTLEEAYRALALDAARAAATPPLFMAQLAQLVARAAFERAVARGEADAFSLRAAELFFRPQRLTVHEGRLLLADLDRIEDAESGAPAQAGHRHGGPHASPLLAMFAPDPVTSIDVLSSGDVAAYAMRSDAHDLALDFRLGGEGRAGFARAIEIWVRHLSGAAVSVTAVPAIEDADWAWFVGLDRDATAIGNALWRGETVPEVDRARVVALFELRFLEPERMLAAVRGRPVTLILAMSEDRIVRVKGQNLLAGLPFAAPS